MLTIVLFVLMIHANYIENIQGTLIVENDSNSFRVLVNELVVLYHSNSAPMFHISKTMINFTEHHGNFRINETIEAGPVLLNSFSLREEANQNGTVIWTATLSNAENSSSATVSLDL